MRATDDCSGAFTAMTTDPMMQLKQPTLPTKLNRSFKNIVDNIAHITTERAPMGVTRIASVKAYATRLLTDVSRAFGHDASQSVPYFSHNHKCHAEPPPGILKVPVAFSRLFIVFLVRLQ